MRKTMTLLLSMFFVLNIEAQKANETVYLKNGSIIKGTVIEQVPNESLKIRTADGSLFVYQMSEVEKITKEEAEQPVKKAIVSDGKHRGLDFGINAGYLIGVGDAKDANCPSVELSLGKQLNKNLYLGLGAGAWIPSGDADLQIPVSVDSKIMFPSSTSNITPLGIFRLGYVINTAEDKKIDGGGYGPDQTIEAKNAFMLQIMPGIELPLSKRTDFLLAAGYTHAFTDGGGNGYFSVKAGLNFHKDQSAKRRPKRPKRPKAPIREKGFQLTLEGGTTISSGGVGPTGNLVFAYKMNHHLSLGLGGGFETIGLEKNGTAQVISGKNENHVDMSSSSASAVKAFVRGSYRITERRFAPIVSCDAGMRFYLDNSDYYSRLGDISYEDNAIFVAPSIGFSWRTTNNSYIEMKAGYEFAQPNESQKGVKNNNYYCIPSIDTSAAFVTIGFTHTFGKRPARPPRPE